MGTTALTAIGRSRSRSHVQGNRGVQHPPHLPHLPHLQGTVRERAAALFDPPDLLPDPDPEPDSNLRAGPDPAPPHPGASGAATPGPGDGVRLRLTPAERLRAFRGWLYVRCGLEFRTAVALLVVLAVAVGFAVQHFWTGRPRTVSAPARIDGPSPGASPASLRGPGSAPGSAAVGSGPSGFGPAAVVTAKPVLTVDVAGQARRPGLLRLPAGSRVADALAAAGGALPGTDTSALNLARVLTDGEQLVVGGPPTAAAPGPGGGAPAGPISLSSATSAQLETLPGVGPVLARHILDYRAQHGGFASVDQLRDVTGIGDRRFSDLKPLVQP
ncbi:ComEA family DNA-binding protein [Streptomyces sp. SPB162]|uniref:ComEA family DNA-binding protein n=1 Tax=Streptomyces sp. SPB162 TaxID=2940560 RepID=UPI002405D7EF|nr:ComEA family DNA-binding protein [Streptomyces sp. SPB162]MDF9813215.1 competence protein ComEA [Streptomyces sp. SPB162]